MHRSSSLWLNSALVAGAQGLSGAMMIGTQVLATRSIGLGDITDGFFVAYVVPEVVAGIFFSLGVLVLVPRILVKNGVNREGRALCWVFGGATALVLSTISFLVSTFSHSIVSWLGPGLSPKAIVTAESTLRLMAPVLFLQGISQIAVATLQALRQFLAASAGRILFSLGPLVAALTLIEHQGLVAIAWAAVISSFVSTVYLWLVVGISLKLPAKADLANAIKSATRSMAGVLPVALARVTTEITWFVIRALATNIAGGVTLLVMAQRISGVLNLVGNSIGTVAYPDIVREIHSGNTAFSAMTRRRCDQCFTSMSLLAWPLAGVAHELAWIIGSKGELSANETSTSGGLFIALFLLMTPWATANGVIGNATWALQQAWRRLALETMALAVILPLSWWGVHRFGITALAGVLFFQWPALLLGGEWLMRKILSHPVLDGVTLRRWLLVSLLGVLVGMTTCSLSKWGRQMAGLNLSLRLGSLGLTLFVGVALSLLVTWRFWRPMKVESNVTVGL